MDCASLCGGEAEFDECSGECESNVCVGSGNPGAACMDDAECHGICGGGNASCADCLGVPNGPNVYDNCGIECVANDPLSNCSTHCDADLSNDCVQDCAGTWGGSLVDDECDICGGDNSSCSDECGIPNGDNSSCSDECGVPNLSLIHI